MMWRLRLSASVTGSRWTSESVWRNIGEPQCSCPALFIQMIFNAGGSLCNLQ